MAIAVGNGSFTPETQQSAGSSGITTASYTATANALVKVFVSIRGDSGAVTGSPTLTHDGSGSLTFVLNDDATVNDFGNDDSLFEFRATEGGSPVGGTLTFTMPGAETCSSLIIMLCEVTDSSGYDAGNETVIQTGSGGASDPFTPSFAGTSTSGDAQIAAVWGGSDGHSITAGNANWNLVASANIVGTQGLAILYATTGETAGDFDFGSTTGARLALMSEAEENAGGGGGVKGIAARAAYMRAA